MNPMSWTPDDATMTLIRHMAIQNAIEYEGKANPGSVIGRIMGMNADLRPHGKTISPMIAKAVVEANMMAGSHGVEHLRSILQEEAPHLGKPVLVVRESTERPEGIKSGTVKLVKVNKNKIIEETSRLIEDKNYYKKMSNLINPYGDGKASFRIIKFLSKI